MNLTNKYCLCVSGEYKECSEQIKHSNFVEFRLDLCVLTKEERLILYRKQNYFIATCRADDQTTYKRLKEAILNGATYIDVDIRRSEGLIVKLKELTITHGCKLIISYHNYIETPTFEALCDIYNTAQKHEPDLVKICTTVHSLKDNATILSLYQRFNNIIAFGMGEIGKITRLASLYCGAPYTYCSTFQEFSTAKGQLTITKLEALNGLLGCDVNETSSTVIIGFMGVGKTTIGKAYAKLTKRKFIDLDEAIEKIEGCSVSELFKLKGENYFRTLEHQVLSKSLLEKNAVISCGGGIVMNQHNFELLKGQKQCVWLKADVDYCFNQIEKGTRPLLLVTNALETAKKIYQSRKEKYKSLARITIGVENKDINEICIELDEEIKK